MRSIGKISCCLRKALIVTKKEGKNAGVYTVGVIEGSSEMALTRAEYEALSESERAARGEKVKNKFLAAGADAVILNMQELTGLL